MGDYIFKMEYIEKKSKSPQKQIGKKCCNLCENIPSSVDSSLLNKIMIPGSKVGWEWSLIFNGITLKEKNLLKNLGVDFYFFKSWFSK